MPSENPVVETKRGIFKNFPGFRSKERNPPLAETPEKVVEDLERSLTKDDPLIENNTFNGDNGENKFPQSEASENDEDAEKDKTVEADVHHGAETRIGRKPVSRRRVQWSSDLTVHDNNGSYIQSVPGTSGISKALQHKPEITYRQALPVPSIGLGPPSYVSQSSAVNSKRKSKSKDGSNFSDQASGVGVSDATLHMSDLREDVTTIWTARSSVIRELVDEQEGISYKHPEDESPGPQESDQVAPVKSSAGHKKLRLPKFKIPKFRKKHNEDANLVQQQEEASGPSGTEEGVTDEEGAILPASDDQLSPVEEPSTSRPFASEEDISDEEENDDDDEGEDMVEDLTETKPVPKPRPRTLPEPVLTKPVVEEEVHPQTKDEVLPTPTIRKRKKKKKVPKTRRPVPDLPEEQPVTPEVDTKSSVREGDLEEIPVAPNDQPQAAQSSSTRRARTARRKARQQKKDDGLVLGITVHQSDHLRASLKYISHPVVRVSLVDGTTGQYLQKSDSSRSVTSYYESDAISHVLPIMTQPYDFRAHQSIRPRWEETLIFNESFDSLITSLTRHEEEVRQQRQQEGEDVSSLVPVNPRVVKPSPMVFFVIRDFVSMTKANNVRKGKDDVDKGWHNVAWAFLKLIGSDGQPNTGRRVRLQLFHPPRFPTTHVNEQQAQSEVAYFWWRDVPRREYPATVYVTLKAINRPDKMDPTSRSMFATQPEVGQQSYKQLHSSLQFADGTKSATAEDKKPKWSRLPGQTCKIPNAVALRLWSGSDGAFSIRFSNGGTRLAVACKHENSYPILLYGIPGGGEMGCLNNHQQLVYDIQWSNNDDKVVSASADGTAQVWDLNDKSKSTHTLPHPAYVYTASFHPTAQHVVATGGYDCVIRVWNIATPTAQMLQELDGHKSFINSLAFDQTGLTLFSADSNGLVLAWNCHSQEKAKKNYKVSWTMKTKYEDRELSGVCINNIQVHPRNNKLLLHCRDSVMRILDVRIHTLLRMNGAVSHRQHLRSTLTSCGSFVLSGSEDGCAYVWNSDTGDQVAIYNELGFSRSVRDVTFHPHEHMVAFCCFSPNMPVLVYVYDKGVAAIGTGVLPVVGTSQQGRDLLLEPLDRATDGRTTSKMQRIKDQLDSVMPPKGDLWSPARKAVPVAMALSAFADGRKSKGQSSPRGPPPGRTLSPAPGGSYLGPTRYTSQDPYLSYGATDANLTWGSTFDSTMGSSLEPSYLSPHASPEARAIARHLATNQPKPDMSHGWRPTFTAVGGNPYRTGVGPDVSVAIDDQGKRSLQVKTATSIKDEHTVVALYDYQASRSDDLTMYRGDVIKVLYKDGESWWFGERLSDGRQGYFPSNYVALDDNESVASKLETRDQQPEVMFGVPEVRPVSAESLPENKSIHALKMLDGKLNFYSHSESEGEHERASPSTSISSRQRRREQRSSVKNISNTIPLTEIKSVKDEAPQPRARSAAETSPIPRSRTRKRSPREQGTTPARPLPEVTPRQEQKAREIIVEEIQESRAEDVYATVQKSSRTSTPRHKVTFDPVSTGEAPMTSVQAEVHQPPPESPEPKPQNPNDYPELRPRLGILQAVKEKLAESDSMLSSTVVGGPEFDRADYDVRGSRGPMPTSLAPILTSTATKGKKSRSRRNRSSSRGRAPKVLITAPSDEVEEDIPMLELVNRKLKEASGADNFAYDSTSDV